MHFTLILLLSLPLDNVAAQSNSDYLKSLEGEASSMTVDEKTRSDANSSTAGSSAAAVSGQPNPVSGGDVAGLQSGLTIEEFEAVLKQNYIGSYLFYKRLNNSQKNEVFDSYQADPNPVSVRDKILKVSKK